jgi:hypothetical protein
LLHTSANVFRVFPIVHFPVSPPGAKSSTGNIPHLRTIALILGITYMVGFVIEVFGIIAALMVRNLLL